MLEDGIPKDVVYFNKLVRDELPKEPRFFATDSYNNISKTDRIKDYIRDVKEIKDIVQSCKTKDDINNIYKNYLIEGGYIKGQEWSGYTRYTATEKFMDNQVLMRNSKLEKVLNNSKERFYDYYISYKSKNWNIEKQRKKTITNAISKKAYKPEMLSSINRDGINYRQDRKITGDDYLNEFKFRGGEFGNWLNEAERETNLDMCYDALKDLSYALEVKDSDIGFNGDLAIAFGSRGKGGVNSAMAHYETTTRAINLTKMKGAGS